MSLYIYSHTTENSKQRSIILSIQKEQQTSTRQITVSTGIIIISLRFVTDNGTTDQKKNRQRRAGDKGKIKHCSARESRSNRSSRANKRFTAIKVYNSKTKQKMLDLLSKNEDHRRHCRHVSATGEETARRRKFKSRRIQQKIICCCVSDALQVCQLLDMCQAYSTARHLLELRKVCGMCQEKKKKPELGCGGIIMQQAVLGLT